MVEYKLPKLGVAGSNPVARSTFFIGFEPNHPFLRFSIGMPVVLLRIADTALVVYFLAVFCKVLM